MAMAALYRQSPTNLALSPPPHPTGIQSSPLPPAPHSPLPSSPLHPISTLPVPPIPATHSIPPPLLPPPSILPHPLPLLPHTLTHPPPNSLIPFDPPLHTARNQPAPSSLSPPTLPSHFSPPAHKTASLYKFSFRTLTTPLPFSLFLTGSAKLASKTRLPSYTFEILAFTANT